LEQRESKLNAPDHDSKPDCKALVPDSSAEEKAKLEAGTAAEKTTAM